MLITQKQHNFHTFQYIIIKMDTSLIDLFQHYTKKEQERAEIEIHGQIEGYLDFCEYTIRTQYDKNSKSKYRFKKRKGAVSEEFMRAYNELSGPDKMRYYIKNVNYLVRISSGNYTCPLVEKGKIEGALYTRSFNLKRWKKKIGRLDKERKILYVEKQGTIRQYNLANYLYRISKNNDYFSFVLEAIYDSVTDKTKTVHIGFKQASEMKKWSENIQLCIDFRHWERIYKTFTGNSFLEEDLKGSRMKSEVKSSYMNLMQQKQTKIEQRISVKKVFQSQNTQKMQKLTVVNKEQVVIKEQRVVKEQPEDDLLEVGQKSRTIIDSLIESDNDEDIEEIQMKDKSCNDSKKNIDLFHRMFPDFELEQLEEQNYFEMVFKDKNSRLLHSMNDLKNYKIVLSFPEKFDKNIIFNALCVPEFQAQLLPNIEQIKIKTLISSENSAIMYQKNRPYNKLYRSRDFVFVRHGFRKNKDFYVVDRKIENSNYPPFMTIVRGDYSCIWGILEKKDEIKVVGDLTMNHQGYLNDQQQKNLSLNYMKGYMNLIKFCQQKSELKNCKLFELGWNIDQNKQNIKANLIRLQKKKERRKLKQEQARKLKSETKIEKNENILEPLNTSKTLPEKEKKKQVFEDQGQINIKELEAKHETAILIERKFNQNGFVLIENNFIKTRYLMSPIQVKKNLYLQSTKGHPIWKGQWIHDKKEGGIIFIDEKKIEDQKGVLKFILTKIGKNLLSGKSVLNISLPVDIFCPESNLERLIFSLTYAPKILQQVTKKPTFQRFKALIAFGISSSPLYLNMQKPFNPILGETFQCWVNGCPAFAEQISHHPPIGALFFAGRGYRITAQLESKVELHMNSGCGINDGIYRVSFDNGEEMCFILPGGEVSGLTYGDRKFNMVGKAYYWVQKTNYFVELIYNPNKKGMFSIGKQENPSDYFEGTIVEVKPEFMKTFIEKKKKPPTDNEIINRMGKISGVWHKYVKFNDQILIDFDNQFPFRLEYESNPLPSDANWRQDIAYRRINEISRAQTEKQRLEVFQRGDRKLREKFHKKK